MEEETYSEDYIQGAKDCRDAIFRSMNGELNSEDRKLLLEINKKSNEREKNNISGY